MLSQEPAFHDFEYDPVLDVASSEQLRLGDLRNFRPIDQSDLKILEELDGFGQYVMTDSRDLCNAYRNDFAGSVNANGVDLMWEDADMKPDVQSTMSSLVPGDYWSAFRRAGPVNSQPEIKSIDWLRGGYQNQQQVAPVSNMANASEPTLMELNLNAEPMFCLPSCPEVDEDLLSTLTDCHSPNDSAAAPQDGRFCVPFTVPRGARQTYSTSYPNASTKAYSGMQTSASFSGYPVTFKSELMSTLPQSARVSALQSPSGASTLRALLENRESSDSDSQSETSTEPREPRGRAWSLDTNGSGRSTATSGVFELSRSWTSQSSSDAAPSSVTLCDTASGRTRNFSTGSNSSSVMSGTSSEATVSSRPHRRRTNSCRRSASRAGDQQLSPKKSSKSRCFWYQRDVKARSNLLPVAKVSERSYEADYDQPNPKRLLQLGNEINKMSDVLQSVPQPSSVNDDDDKLNTKREKNKFASRVCRLKKKARYEANKIKLFGLKHELGQVKSLLADARQLIGETSRNDKQQMAALARRLRELWRTRLGLMLAGSQTEYVNLVLDLAQRPLSHQSASTGNSGSSGSSSIRERLLAATAVDNPEMRSLALKHSLPTYAEYF